MAESESHMFSLRMRSQDYRALQTYAGLMGKPVAAQAREFILAGLRDALDPEEIEHRIEKEKARMLEATRRLREERPSAAYAAKPPKLNPS